MLVVCERWVGDGDGLLHIDPKFFWLSHSGWTAQPWVTEGRKSLVCKLILTLASCSLLNPSATGTGTGTAWLKPSVAPGYIIVWYPPASCVRTHLHRIQPRPRVKVIFRYLRPDAPVSMLHRCISWLMARSRVNMLQYHILPYGIRFIWKDNSVELADTRYPQSIVCWFVSLMAYQLSRNILS